MKKFIPSTAKVTAGMLVGNILEWYGFTLFAQFSSKHLALFFPDQNPFMAKIISAALFASAFILRPIGGIVYAHYGDRYGRLTALMASIVLMLIPTFLIGLVPPYDVIGVAAPTILVILRMLQGLSAGGEYPGSFTFAVEYAESQHRGLMGSITFAGAVAGMLLASLSFTLVELFVEQTNSTFAWRIPFFASALLAIIGYLILRNISENQIFIKLKLSENTSTAPLTEALRTKPLTILAAFLVCAIAATTIYLMFVSMTRFLTVDLGVRGLVSATVTDFSLLLLTLFIPLMGYLSDKVGRKPVMICGTLGLIIDAYPMFLLYAHENIYFTFASQILLGILGACVVGPLSALLVEMFPTRIRYSAVALAYNMAFVVFGGAAPFATVYLIHKTNNPASPSLILIVAGILSLAVLLRLPETYKKSL